MQQYKYNGKELDRMHGLNTYDYGARQHAPILGRWDRIDPLCEKYYSTSPYTYCSNNPVNAIDPDGNLCIFVNGMHNGYEGGVSSYRGGFDQKFMRHFGDFNKCRHYYDGSLGGVAMLWLDYSHNVRENMGWIKGKINASRIIQDLARDKNGRIIEKLRIVSHSMGAAYAKGLVKAIIEYAKKTSRIM